jgi:tetratricopeptide (TPR) repeat protein
MLRKLDAAHTECDRALDLSKGNDEYTVNAWIVKTTILIDEGRTADALTVIEASLRRYPNVNRNLQLLRKGELVASEGRYADAIAILRPLLQTKGFDKSEVAIIHHSLGVSHGALGQWDAAGSHLLKAESLDVPEGYRATNRFWLAHAAAKRGDFRSAKSHLLNALSLAGHSNVDLLRDLYESLSNVSRELGDKADAAMYGSMWEALPLKPK